MANTRQKANYKKILTTPAVRAVSRMRRPNHSEKIDETKLLKQLEKDMSGWINLSSKAMAKIKAD